MSISGNMDELVHENIKKSSNTPGSITLDEITHEALINLKCSLPAKVDTPISKVIKGMRNLAINILCIRLQTYGISLVTNAISMYFSKVIAKRADSNIAGTGDVPIQITLCNIVEIVIGMEKHLPPIKKEFITDKITTKVKTEPCGHSNPLPPSSTT